MVMLNQATSRGVSCTVWVAGSISDTHTLQSEQSDERIYLGGVLSLPSAV